jgi:ATP synthase protein I
MNWLDTRRARRDPELETSVVQASGAVKKRSGPPPDNAGWTIFSYLLSGMLVYGLLGWLLATLTHIGLLIPLGALAGLLVAIGGIVYKYGRS